MTAAVILEARTNSTTHDWHAIEEIETADRAQEAEHDVHALNARLGWTKYRLRAGERP